MHEKEPSVLILMAAYNGAHFLRPQLDSILGQHYENWTLIIQDDGSTDETPAVLKEYAARDSRIRVLENEGRHGAYPNFHSLVRKARGEASFDYYMFSDHDDIWLPGKIRYLVRLAESRRKERPLFLYADMSVIDAEGQVLAESLDAQFGLSLPGKWSRFYQHSVFGCNSMMNRALFEAVPLPDEGDPEYAILSHDNYFAKYAALFGEIRYCPKILMQYRRYGSNVTAANAMTISPKRVLERLGAFDELARDHARTYVQSLYALRRFMPFLSGKEEARAAMALRSMERGGLYALYAFLALRIRCGKKVRTLSRLLVLISGRYKRYLDAGYYS